MADAAPTSFENLTQSGLLRVNSKDDKNVSMSIDTYQGNTSIVVFTGAGGKPWKTSLPLRVRLVMIALLRRLQADPTTRREAITLQTFDDGSTGGKKGFKAVGQLGFGIDESMMFYIDIAANDLQGRHMFPFKPDAKFDFVNTSLTERDMIGATIEYFITTLNTIVPIAERISSFKRAPGGGGNRGNFGGGGGQRGGGGGGYGGGQQGGGGGAFGGGGGAGNGAEVSDNLYV
jgi:hypothetical protein